MSAYILSDPNFSDGTRSEVIEKIVDQFRERDGVKLIGYEPDADFDRLPVEVLNDYFWTIESIIIGAGDLPQRVDRGNRVAGGIVYIFSADILIRVGGAVKGGSGNRNCLTHEVLHDILNLV